MPVSGFFFDTIIRQEPLDEANLKVEDNLEEFGEWNAADIEYWNHQSELAARSDKAVLANLGGTALGDIALVPGPFLTHPKGIRDVSEWYMSTVLRQDFLHRIFTEQTDIALNNLETAHRIFGDRIDVVFICGTDFGTQDSQFCSAEDFNELYAPYYKKINGWIHRHTTWKTFKHTCGSINPLLPALIEAGFDIINPVQINARDMDAAMLKREYGSQVTFWGGGVDTQKVLPFGTPDEVKKQVLAQCEILSRDGGFVFNTVHNIQANVPLENVVAMLDAIKQFNGG
jgi:uroporphyrinogen-III decarboxylase